MDEYKMETKKISWKARIKMAAVTGLAAILGAVNTATAEKPSFYVESAVASDLVTKHGVMIKGPCRQDFFNIDFNNGFSGFVWQDYSPRENDYNERDFGGSYSLKIKEGLSASVGYQYWDYPSKTFGKFDSVLKAGVKYSNVVDFEYDLTHMFGHDTTPTADRHYFKASKAFQVGKIGDADISLTPSISTAFTNDYYGRTGLTQITPGVNLGISKKLGKGTLILNASVNDQHGQQSDIEDHVWGVLSAGYSF
jgi:hypothetical protein